ncbi:hypothetical protein VVR12_01885 [Rothia sp. LK2588]|uniref:hypothetical protein n=1 Tax=Rothia sp. LK2588 TaxID=3114369 RepID=UPI0034CF54BB
MTTTEYLNKSGIAHHLGVNPSSVTRYHLPAPDATLKGSGGKTQDLWLTTTIDEWNSERNPNMRKTSKQTT